MKALRHALASLAVLVAPHAFAWTPPEKPDPRAILEEAVADARAGRYEDALRKHEWFRAESPKSGDVFAGARNSFALSSWAELAKHYPPAGESLRRLRAHDLDSVRAGRDVVASFDDYAAINRVLGDDRATVEAFERLEERDPAAAKLAFRRAEDALIEQGRYETVGRYLQPKEELELASKTYWLLRSRPRDTPEYGDMVERFFATAAGRVVAVLVKLDRRQEADEIHKIAIRVSSSELVKDTVGRALQGELPPPVAPRAIEPPAPGR